MNDPAEMDSFLPIGKITGVHGIKGNLKIMAYAEELSIFKPESTLFVKKESGAGRHYTVRWAKPHQRKALLAFKEVNDRNHAEELTGSELYIKKALLPKPEDGSFYWFEIIGIKVFSINGSFLGTVETIIPAESHDVYTVNNRETGKETLIPAIKQFIKTIDINNNKMIVDLPEGL